MQLRRFTCCVLSPPPWQFPWLRDSGIAREFLAPVPLMEPMALYVCTFLVVVVGARIYTPELSRQA